jgi:hypothetical protein
MTNVTNKFNFFIQPKKWLRQFSHELRTLCLLYILRYLITSTLRFSAKLLFLPTPLFFSYFHGNSFKFAGYWK